MSTTYHIQPQRSTGKGWVDCLQHQAHRFAIVERKVFKPAPGKRAAVERIVAKFERMAEAETHLDTRRRVAKPLPRPTLGQRFAKTGRKIIAASLSYEQFHSLRKD